MKRIIRVFPKKNSYLPVDEYAFYGLPPFPQLMPEHDEVHISCTFTWDKQQCEWLAANWESATNKPVKIGGPAFGSMADDFQQGMYLKPNIIFTSRGCNNQCPWCIVPKIEGNLKELPICQGNIIQDNNFLQCSRQHKDKVFDMLRTQHTIQFKGGLDVTLIDDHFVNSVTSLRINELWLACDSDEMLPKFKVAAQKLRKAGFSRDKIHCYALIGDNMNKNEARLREIWYAGAMPFAQLRMDFGDKKTEHSQEWRKFQEQWTRPPAIIAHMTRNTHFTDKF